MSPLILGALKKALCDCKIPEAGPGHVVYRVDGDLLYERVKALVDMQEKPSTVNREGRNVWC